tara:strand:+ start:5940 stop:6779 length:840 start_codon:yes stop_codon:yes gene_type:complete
MKLNQYIQLYSTLGSTASTASLEVSSSAQVSSSLIDYEFNYTPPVSLGLSGSLSALAIRYNAATGSLTSSLATRYIESSSLGPVTQSIFNIGSLTTGSNLNTRRSLIGDSTTDIEGININITGNITASGDISSSLDVHGQKFISNGKNVISYNTADDTVTVNSGLGNLFLAGNVTASSTGQGNISASGDVFGDRLVVGTRVETPRVSVGDGTQLFVGDTQGMRLEGPVTASTHISSSGDLTSNKLTVASNEINFTNLPTSDPGVVGRLYRDGGTVKISI